MKNRKHIILWILPALLIMMLTGCAPGVTYVIDVAYAPKIKELAPSQKEPVRIAIRPFEDARKNKKGIGSRHRLTGRTDEFEVRPYPATAAVTETLVNALKINGYMPVVVTGGKDLSSITEETSAQFVLTGTIEELRAEAFSRAAYTEIKTKVVLKVNVYSVDNKGVRTLTVQSQSSPSVVFFSPAIIQNVINDTLTEAINKLLATPLK